MSVPPDRASDFASRQGGSLAVVRLRTLISVAKRSGWRRTMVVTVNIVRRNSAKYVLTARTERPKCQKHVVTQNGGPWSEKAGAQNVTNKCPRPKMPPDKNRNR